VTVPRALTGVPGVSPDATAVTSPPGQDATCTRCGHHVPHCDRCGHDDPFLGGMIGDQPYCHTFSASRPTCYMLSQGATGGV
jgi:hypothetical protein